MTTDRRDFLKASLAAGALAGMQAFPGRFVLPAWADIDPDEALRELELRGLDSITEKAENPQRILIMGGTAFIGPAFIEMARARGHQITLFNRGHTNPQLFPDLDKIQGDRGVAEDVEQLRGREFDVVLDTSAYYPRVVDSVVDIFHETVKQYVLISTVSVYASFATPGMDESGELATLEDPTTEEVTGETYGGLKVLCENAVRDVMPDRTTIIRPGLIVGPLDRSDRFTYWPVRVSRGGEVLAPGNPEQGIQVIDVRDLMRFTLRCIEDGTMGTFNCASKPGLFSMRGLMETCREQSGSDAKFTWVPASFLEEQEVAPWSDMPVWVPSDGDEAGFDSIDVSRAIAKGLTFRALDDTVRDTLDWWKVQPENADGPRTELRSGIKPEREAEVLAAWHGHEEAGE